MPDVTYNLRCTSCGQSLRVPADVDLFACGGCGIDLSVQRQGGMVSLRSQPDAAVHGSSAADKTAAELALRRLGPELRSAEKRVIDVKSRLDTVHEDSQVVGGVSHESTLSTVLVVALLVEIVAFVIFFIMGFRSNDHNLLIAILVTVGLGVITFVLFGVVHSIDNAAAARSFEVRKAEADARLREQLLDELSAAKADVAKLNERIAQNREIVDS
jgi:hypothetical protein